MTHPFQTLEGVFEAPLDGHLGPFGIPAMSQQFYETYLSRYCLGRRYHKAMRQRFPHLIRVTVMGEDLPKEHNRVEIDPDLKDTSSIPAPRVVYGYSENSLKMLEHGGNMSRQALQAAGATDILDRGLVTPAYHLMGTARMGTDPRKSVVNASHRAHDVPHPYVVDGSSFTTSAAVNPTSTIGALALRAADKIWKKRKA